MATTPTTVATQAATAVTRPMTAVAPPARSADAARPLRHATGDRWFVDESLSRLPDGGLYRAVDQYGQVVDVLLSEQRDAAAARRFADHDRLKARLRPMRGLKHLRSAARIVAGHAFVQNLRRNYYGLATDASPQRRLATAFTELALAA